MKVLVFGTGNTYRRFRHFFEHMEIAGFVDNNPAIWGTRIEGTIVIPPEKVPETEFDFIFLVSIYYESMRKQLVDMGIPAWKIMDKDHRGFLAHISQTEHYLFPQKKTHGKHGKRILMFSHVLNLSGAPVVLCRLASFLKKRGFEVTMVAEKNSALNHGPLLYMLLQEQISVIMVTDYHTLDVEYLALGYDLYWVNTVLLGNIVKQLLNMGKPIFWWLHETENIYNTYKENLVFPSGNNLYVLSGGWMAAESFEKYSGHKTFCNLMYGIPDLTDVRDCTAADERIKIGLVAEYSKRKGQDILFQVIRRNEHLWKNIAEFYFVGVFPEDKKLEYENISMVHVLGEMSPKELTEFYGKIDVLAAPSLYDPMPVVVTEAMQHKKACLVTDMVGQSRYICHKQNGMVCCAGDEKELEENLWWILANKDQLKNMGNRCFEIYQEYFSMESFENNVEKLLRKIGLL